MRLIKGLVTGVAYTPENNLPYTVSYTQNGETMTTQAAIVINCLGKGKPKDPTIGPVTTTKESAQHAKHWQEVLIDKNDAYREAEEELQRLRKEMYSTVVTAERDKFKPHIRQTEQARGVLYLAAMQEAARKLAGQHFTFVGFGNSTVEMVRQIQRLNQYTPEKPISYTVITHHSQEEFNSGTIYRNTAEDLTRLAGDILDVREAVEEATKGHVIFDAAHWEYDADKKEGNIAVTLKDGSTASTTCDRGNLYTLIGYQRTKEEATRLGILLDETGTPLTDYDGEVQIQPGVYGRDRVCAGYFLLGGARAGKKNPNDETIPGILFRMQAMLPSILVRAQESSMRRSLVKNLGRRVAAIPKSFPSREYNAYNG